MAVDDEESLHRAIARIGYPCVLKTRTLGYDGHGQAVLRGEADLAKARELLAVPCILRSSSRSISRPAWCWCRTESA